MSRDDTDDHTQTIFVAPRALTADQVKAFTERIDKCAEDGTPMLLSPGWGVYSGPPWLIHPTPEPWRLEPGSIITPPRHLDAEPELAIVTHPRGWWPFLLTVIAGAASAGFLAGFFLR